MRLRASPETSRAVRRVANYLRALGLSDRGRLRELSQQIVLQVTADDAEQHAARAVAEAQARFDAWRTGLYRALPDGVDPLWLRAFIGARPELFLGDVERAQRAALLFGDPRAGKAPRRARFRPQEFEPARVPQWFLGLAAPLLLAWGPTYALFRAVGTDGWTWLELGWVSLFAFLFSQASVGLTTAVLGFISRPGPAETVARGGLGTGAVPRGSAGLPSHAAAAKELPLTALLMPIYHESAEDVFAALAGMQESLAALPGGEAFEIFVLSDSQNPEICADEERAFRRVVAAGGRIPIYYHRRANNVRQKAGNLAEFFERWGLRYTYAVTLDADSIMSGATLLELVRRIEAEPNTALIQAPLSLHGAETLFARALAFSASVCGPVFTRGLSIWSGTQANYYGHNAVVRVRAFLDCCALPKLHGEPPFGGHVLSHDFVEAALLCRAGWNVRIAHDLSTGSYEGLPPTLGEYVARDHRWCQGNLQHLRIARMQGLEPMSRIHLLLGAFAYLAGPAWLLFMTFGVLLWRQTGAAFESVAALVATATVIVLVGPWLLGLIDSARDASRRRAHAGGLRLFCGTVLGIVVGALQAPLLMLHHTRIVLSILTGHAVGWGSQQRRAASSVARVLRLEWPTTLLGLGVAIWLYFAQAALFWRLSPLWVPWCLAIPIDLAVSSARLGRLARRMGLLVIPSELEPENLLLRVEQLRVLTRSDASARFRDLVLDPVLVAAHLAKLQGKPSTEPRQRLAQLCRRALREGPASLSAVEWRALAGDAESMQRLHREAWRRWPVESWDLERDPPREPPETPRYLPALAQPGALPDAAPASDGARGPLVGSDSGHAPSNDASASPVRRASSAPASQRDP
jgi:membrane glycosyltransferase